MKKYQTYWLTIITIICLLSLTLSVCSVIDYTFLAESFIGVVGTYIGIAVTLIIGYQIFNIIYCCPLKLRPSRARVCMHMQASKNNRVGGKH